MTLDDFFNCIEVHYNKTLPFVVYRKPNDNAVKTLLQKTNNLYFTKNFTEQGFVFSPFDNTKDSVLMPFEESEVITANYDVGRNVEQIEAQNNKADSLDSKNHHINLIKKGINAINNNDFKKVVLSRKEIVAITEANPISIFKKLLNNYSSAFVYCWYHPKVGIWLGATPETLVKIEGNQFSVMSLAGTQNYNGTLDVVWKDKEKHEQKIVTDFIVENIKTSVANIKVSENKTIKAGNLLHIKTQISGTLNFKLLNFKQLLSNLHPTPAVCGFPKQKAKQFILKHENYNREFYTGFLGELNIETTKAPRSGKRNIENRAYSITKKRTQLYVNLRCMQLKNNKAIIYIGGGITKSSDAESEWNETVSKSQTIKKVL